MIIYIGHQLWQYASQSFIKKKYIVSSQIEKYKSIIQELQENVQEPMIEDTTDLQMDLEDFYRGNYISPYDPLVGAPTVPPTADLRSAAVPVGDWTPSLI